MLSHNKFQLGLFASNCSNGMTMTKAPERWENTWENNVRAAQLADEAGLEFMLPVGRWKGYGGETDSQKSSFETITWATGLLAVTKNISVFGTVHVALIHPVFAAKQMATADHVGRGRFGLNVVAGWNAAEFGMFGVPLMAHEDRYAYAEEWLSVAKRIWSEPEPFDYNGQFFQLKDVQGMPGPYRGEAPLVMSAGSSQAGSAFAFRNADCLFMVINDLDSMAKQVADLHAMATDRKFGVFASSHLVCRPTRKEAEDYYHYIVDEMGDWAAADYMAKARETGKSIEKETLQQKQMKRRFIAGSGTWPVVGSYDDVVETYSRFSAAGLQGVAVGLINYIDEFPHLRDEVLPRMERAGLREPVRVTR
ncbi:LLM class flavin-dependent oxidoreductase [Amycolatopsis sp. GM8]|uniref:LLM class flavin-dependent oxidoreductase n=1 Tax=Amycolatopsis sp. GM8 TaxID=2896530 RepID=UPI001F340045|nr:LLM class flavin-dependent oxidoreductase [Amycolatopsis sp. GM8]